MKITALTLTSKQKKQKKQKTKNKKCYTKKHTIKHKYNAKLTSTGKKVSF